MARKRDTRSLRADKDGITTISEVLPELERYRPELKEALTTAAELPDPNLPTFAEKIARKQRPTGPRKRDGEPAASFASEDLRISTDGHTWQVEARRELTGAEKDRLAASGFHAVDDSEQIWNGPEAELRRRGTDVNHVAFALSGKQEGRGR